jgi:glycosyltransferase involved in cell wall biosynthesis
MPAKSKPCLVVLIPALNEESTIGSVIRAIPRRIAGLGKILVLVVDDGSTDRTVQKARLAKADKIVSHGLNKGLGIAFKTGIETALKMGADIIVNIDADGQFNTEDIERIIALIASGKADVVTCSRFKKKSFEPKMPFVKKLGNKLFTRTINFFTKNNFTDTQCGFRAYSREAALRLSLFAKFTYTQETLIDLINKGMRIEEVACRVKGQRKGQSRMVKSWYSYGIKALLIVVRSLRDYKPMMFFGGIGTVLIGMGVVLGLYNLFLNPIPTQVWEAYVLGILIVLGFLLMILALIADMLDRQRRIQEEILYRLRKKGLSG